MHEAERDVGPARRNAWFWAVVYVVAVFATSWVSRLIGLQAPWSTLVFLVPMLLLIPMTRAYQRRERAMGVSSPAWRTYGRRATVAVVVFLILMLGSFQVRQALEPQGVLAWNLALLPTLPLLALLWAMGRYIREEEDEYLRMVFIRSALFAAANLVALAIVWGFLEAAGLVPHLPVWVLGPIGGACMGLATAVQRMRV